MTAYLLDVNALIALVDRLHVHHERAHQWFADGGRSEWLSCPLTQNGMLRVISSPRYPNAQPVAAAFASLTSLVGSGHHRFIPDSVSLLESFVDPTRILASNQVTDTYLIALAKAHDARLATFDARISTQAVADGRHAVHQIP